MEKIDVKTNFKDGQKIQYKLTATGEKSVCCIIENELKMMHGRIYYVPINCDKNSDDFIIKVLSDYSENIDVRYIKKNVACLMPLCHNIKIGNNEKFCELLI